MSSLRRRWTTVAIHGWNADDLLSRDGSAATEARRRLNWKMHHKIISPEQMTYHPYRSQDKSQLLAPLARSTAQAAKDVSEMVGQHVHRRRRLFNRWRLVEEREKTSNFLWIQDIDGLRLYERYGVCLLTFTASNDNEDFLNDIDQDASYYDSADTSWVKQTVSSGVYKEASAWLKQSWWPDFKRKVATACCKVVTVGRDLMSER